MANYETFDTWRDTSEVYARMAVEYKGRDIEPLMRLLYVKIRATREAWRALSYSVGLTLVVTALWWFSGSSVRTYAGWIALASVLLSIPPIVGVIVNHWEADKATREVFSRLRDEEAANSLKSG